MKGCWDLWGPEALTIIDMGMTVSHQTGNTSHTGARRQVTGELQSTSVPGCCFLLPGRLIMNGGAAFFNLMAAFAAGSFVAGATDPAASCPLACFSILSWQATASPTVKQCLACSPTAVEKPWKSRCGITQTKVYQGRYSPNMLASTFCVPGAALGVAWRSCVALRGALLSFLPLVSSVSLI